MDKDLETMSREQLIEEAKKLRKGIRQHRDGTQHDLCWHHPALWGLLPEKNDPVPAVPDWPEFIRGCVKYRQSLDEQIPNAPRKKIIPKVNDFLAAILGEESIRKMRSLRTDTEEFHVHGCEIYWLRRKKQDGSTFSSLWPAT